MDKPLDKGDRAATDSPQPFNIGPEAYISRDYARAELSKLWRKVWFVVGRLEEIPRVGDYVTHELMDESVVVVRSAAEKVSAFHNVCVHRGRRLVGASCEARDAGRTKEFRCGYHGWRYSLEGENSFLPDAEDWGGALTSERTRLRTVRADTWGGWVFVSLDPEVEPLLDYLAPIPEMLDPFGLQNMRYKWRRWGIFDCNWKVALEAFMEGYHVETTHPEFNRFGSYRSQVKCYGRHSTRGYAVKGHEENTAKLRLGSGGDPRINTAEMVDYTMKFVDTNFTDTLHKAALRLPQELPEGTPAPEVLKHWIDSARRDDAARGVIWPTVDPEHVRKAGNTWQVFPNFKIGHSFSNALCYSARPYGDDPDKCIFEAFTLELYPEGGEPATEWEFVPMDDERWGGVLSQDFSNMAAVQRGMKASGFPGACPNPVQEDAITCLHRGLADYMGVGAPEPL
jgi:phenylpropionate dioxygenase-like ring-hydroxylating dioxygenase large terminal subunit